MIRSASSFSRRRILVPWVFVASSCRTLSLHLEGANVSKAALAPARAPSATLRSAGNSVTRGSPLAVTCTVGFFFGPNAVR